MLTNIQAWVGPMLNIDWAEAHITLSWTPQTLLKPWSGFIMEETFWAPANITLKMCYITKIVYLLVSVNILNISFRFKWTIFMKRNCHSYLAPKLLVYYYTRQELWQMAVVWDITNNMRHLPIMGFYGLSVAILIRINIIKCSGEQQEFWKCFLHWFWADSSCCKVY